jgi:hypothetical protein
MTADDFTLVVDEDGYKKWKSDKFVIAKYRYWYNTVEGEYFVAYDINSNRINHIPVGSFDEALALCKEY